MRQHVHVRAATPQCLCLVSCVYVCKLSCSLMTRCSPNIHGPNEKARRRRARSVGCMVDGGSKGRGSRGRGTSSRGRGRGAEPPPPRPPPPRREEAPAHNHEPAAGADNVADDEDYLALAASITHMMRDEVASRDKLTKRVSELESALTAAQHAITPPPPLRLFRARLAALGGSVLPGAGETGPLGAQPLPRMLERTPLTPAAFSTYPGGTKGDGGPAHAQQRPTGAAA